MAFCLCEGKRPNRQECVLGGFVYVGKGVRIGNGVKLENRATVYRGVKIEGKVFVGSHVTFINDPYPKSLSTEWKIVETLVKEGASIGAGAVVVCGVTIGEYALIGAGSVVTRDIPSMLWRMETQLKLEDCR